MRVGILLFSCIVLSSMAGAQEPKDLARSLEKQISKLISTAEPSIVGIVVSHSLKYPPLSDAEKMIPGWLGRYVQNNGPFRNQVVVASTDKLDLGDPSNVPDNTFGTGIVLDDSKGLILTNYHLVEGATKIFVRFSNGKGTYANFHAYDGRSDLAVLKLIDIPADGIRSVKLGLARVNPGPNNEPPTVTRGQWVVSIGHPSASGFVDGSPSASWGILSNIKRRSPGATREEQRNRALHHYGCLLQTDARVTLGCSGAGLFNLDGELIGISTPLAALLGAETAGGLVLPLDPNYRRIIAELMRGREVEYGFLGVSILQSRNNERLENGLPISSVLAGTPAAEAGLLSGDAIISIDGNPLKEQDDLFIYVGAALAGTKVKIMALRAGRTRQVEATLVKVENSFPTFGVNRPQPVAGLRVDYSSVKLAINAVGNAGPRGVIIRDIEPKSEAETAFKRLDPGNRMDDYSRWLITNVNNNPVSTPAEFYNACARQRQVELRVIDPKDGSSFTVTLNPTVNNRP
jgi:serine protease Do